MTATEFNERIIPMYGAMHSVATRIMGNREDGADVVQDVFRKLWERRKQIESDSNLSGYVTRAVRNQCVDVIRSRVTEVSIDEVVVKIDDTVEFDRMRRLDEAISKIDDKRLAILRMSIDGLKSEQIAKSLSLSPANIRQLLSRTRKELKRMMTETEN